MQYLLNWKRSTFVLLLPYDCHEYDVPVGCGLHCSEDVKFIRWHLSENARLAPEKALVTTRANSRQLRLGFDFFKAITFLVYAQHWRV